MVRQGIEHDSLRRVQVHSIYWPSRREQRSRASASHYRPLTRASSEDGGRLDGQRPRGRCASVWKVAKAPARAKGPTSRLNPHERVTTESHETPLQVFQSLAHLSRLRFLGGRPFT